MKKLSILLAAPLTLGLMFIACQDPGDPVDAALPDGTGPSFDTGPVIQSVTGAGNFTDANGNFRTFAFNARLYADGSFKGQWERVNHVDESTTKSHGVVTCFTIIGNQAWLGGFATSGAFSEPDANEVGWRVIDNGEAAGSPPDQNSLQFVGAGPGFASFYCGATLEAPGLFDITAGNIQVRP